MRITNTYNGSDNATALSRLISLSKSWLETTSKTSGYDYLVQVLGKKLPVLEKFIVASKNSVQ